MYRYSECVRKVFSYSLSAGVKTMFTESADCMT